MSRVLTLTMIALFALSCGSSASNEAGNESESKESGTVNVETTQAKLQKIPSYLEATGTLSSDAESNVAPTIGGRIVKVNFDVGSYVRRGQAIVELDAADARIRLNQSLAQLEQSKKAVKDAEAGVQQAIARLRQDQARLGIKDGETFDIKDFSRVIDVTARLKLAEKELKRYEKLLASGDVSKSAYDTRLANRDALIGQLAEARSNAAIAIRTISTSEKGVDSARTKVASAKAAVATSETQVAQARKAVRDNVIYAPISGYVSERNADPGEYISPNQPNAKLATIVRTAVLRLKIDIPEQDISKVEIGQGISAQVSAYPDRKFAGTVARILPNLNQQSRTLTVEAEIENIGGLLKPGNSRP